MKLEESIKGDIQEFIYFFFKGSYTFEVDYLPSILRDKDKLYNVFQVFSASYFHQFDAIKAKGNVIEFLKYGKSINENKTSNLSTAFNDVSKKFIYNTFACKVKDEDYLNDLLYNGSDAVSPFATWTNVVEFESETFNVLNLEKSTLKMNARLVEVFEEVNNIVLLSTLDKEQEIW